MGMVWLFVYQSYAKRFLLPVQRLGGGIHAFELEHRAERVGFEPTVGINPRQFSRLEP